MAKQFKKRNFRVQSDMAIRPQGMAINALNFTFGKEETHLMIKEFFSKIVTEEANTGTGVIRYEGFGSEDNSVFLGFCETLDAYTLRFYSYDGMKQFSNFWSNLALSPKFKSCLTDLKISSVISTYTLLSPFGLQNADDFRMAANAIVTSQTKSRPSVKIEGGALIIGSKAGNNCVILEAMTSSSNELGNLVVTYKLKDKNSDKILRILELSKDISIETAVASLLIEAINAASTTMLLEHIRSDIFRNYAVGVAYSAVASTKETTTKDGLYVQRSLSGIWNKLIKQSSAEETKTIILSWLEKAFARQALIPNNEDFSSRMSQLYNKIKPLPLVEAKEAI